jgi:hypothetical protein
VRAAARLMGNVDFAAATAGLPAGLAAGIERAVDHHGGDVDDARDLAQVWRRALADMDRRASAMRSAAARCRCNCLDGGAESHAIKDAWRCGRCYGRRGDGRPQA